MIYKSPAVSVIIPTYNRACSIRRSVQSVLNQTFNDLEVIIIDDGSTDGTKKVLKDFSDKRIRYFGFKYNRGAAIARNIGIKFANGYFISFQDSDDEWLPWKLEKQLKVFKQSSKEVGVVYSAFWMIKGGRMIYKPSPEITVKGGYIHDELFKGGNFITLQSAIVKKECFLNSGFFDENLPRLQDWELWIRISRYYKFRFIEEPLIKVYYTTNSISSNKRALIKAHKIILSKHWRDISKDKKLLSRRCYYVGKLLCENKEIREARKYFFWALKANPRNPKFFLAILISFFGSVFCLRCLEKFRNLAKYLNKLKGLK